jgi:hypothetical protein
LKPFTDEKIDKLQTEQFFILSAATAQGGTGAARPICAAEERIFHLIKYFEEGGYP